MQKIEKNEEVMRCRTTIRLLAPIPDLSSRWHELDKHSFFKPPSTQKRKKNLLVNFRLVSMLLLFFLTTLGGAAGSAHSLPHDEKIVYGKVASVQLDSDASYDDYTSTAECPHGHVVLGCQSITTGCDFDGSAFRETPRTCVTWNSMMFWGGVCPNSTVQAVAICGKVPKTFKARYKDEVRVTSCEEIPGALLVSCTCAIMVGDVACAGAKPVKGECLASPDSSDIRTGVVCLRGDLEVKIITIVVDNGKGVEKCPHGFFMTDCTCSGKACKKRKVHHNKCEVEVDLYGKNQFYGASIICVKLFDE